GEIETFSDEIDVAIVKFERELCLVIALEEFLNEGGQLRGPKIERGADADEAARAITEKLGVAKGAFECEEGGRGALVERFTGFGGCELARRALNESDPEIVFEGSDAPAHGGFR